MTVSLLEILAAARAHAAPLAAESAGYLLLGVADRVVSAPRVTSADLVELSGDGSVRLRAGRAADASGTADSAERSLRHLLGRVLAVSSSVGPALRRAAERSEDVGLDALVRELETALIPVNRSAARRALARLHRETERARDAGKLEKVLFDMVGPDVAHAAHVQPSAAAPPVLSAPKPAPAVALPQAAPVRAVAEPEPRPRRVTPTAPIEDSPVEVVLFSGEADAASPAAAVTAPAEEAFTRPEPVVLRARERAHSTPRLGTLLSAQSGEEEWERTDRAPAVQFEVEQELQPETSRLPDVLTAMLELHTGLDADEAPTRLRDIATAVGETSPSPSRRLASSASQDVETDEDWLFIGSLSEVESDFSAVVSEEQIDPAVHEALTWKPAPVAAASAVVPVDPVQEWAPAAVTPTPSHLPVLILAPVFEPEPSPYVPAVLPVRPSDVSELLQSFHVSGAAEEHELRGALKEMAGLEPTPMPLSYVEEG